MGTKRLFGPAQLTNAAATKYTSPTPSAPFSLMKTIVRHIHVSNPTGSDVTFTMSIGADAAGTRIYDAFTIPKGQAYDAFCMYVLEAGEIIQSFAGTASALVLTLDGDINAS